MLKHGSNLDDYEFDDEETETLAEMGFFGDDVGSVAAIAPKVIVTTGPPRDSKRDFVVVDFNHQAHGNQRVGLNFCNIKRESPDAASPGCTSNDRSSDHCIKTFIQWTRGGGYKKFQLSP
jgi:hypothetical protein